MNYNQDTVDLVIIGSGNGLLHVQHQVISWNSDDLLSTGILRSNFGEKLMEICYISVKKMYVKM